MARSIINILREKELSGSIRQQNHRVNFLFVAKNFTALSFSSCGASAVAVSGSLVWSKRGGRAVSDGFKRCVFQANTLVDGALPTLVCQQRMERSVGLALDDEPLRPRPIRWDFVSQGKRVALFADDGAV